MKRKILVLGGYGAYGGQISTALARDPMIECVVAGRDATRARQFADTIGAGFSTLDVNNTAALHAALNGVYAVVNACGPAQTQGYVVAEACLHYGIHYVDLSGSRAHVQGFAGLNEAAKAKGCLLVTGASLLPAISSVLVDSVAERFDRIDSIHCALTSGSRNPRGPAALETLLGTAGKPLRMMESGSWHEVYGWGRPQTVRFPAPVGKRRVYLFDAPDLDIFPLRYGTGTVSCRTGFQQRLFNYGLFLLGWLKRRKRVADPQRYTVLLVRLGRLFRTPGSAAGGLRVVVSGEFRGEKTEHHVFMVMRDDSNVVLASSPAVALIRKWVHHGVPASGATPCVGMLGLNDIRAELLGCDVTLVYA